MNKLPAVLVIEGELLDDVVITAEQMASLNEALAVDTGFDLGQWLPDAVTQGLVLGTGPHESTP